MPNGDQHALYLSAPATVAGGALDSVRAMLLELEFIAEALDGEQTEDPRSFLIGDRFLQLISFMGCSPHIEIAPREPADRAFTHVRLLAHAQPHLYWGKQSRPPACPACRQRQQDWLEQLLRPTDRLHCQNCREDFPLPRWQWRKSGAISSLLIRVTQVFPNEAVPHDSLLEKLGETTGSAAWNHFYLTGERCRPLPATGTAAAG
jgi:hypothetical protein